MTLRLSRFWDRDLETGLPDSRVASGRAKNTVSVRGVTMEKVYCAECGRFGGGVTADWTPHIFFLCDGCAMTLRGKARAAGKVEIPGSVVRCEPRY